MKDKLINYFFDDIEEYELYSPYINFMKKVIIVSLIATILIKIFL